MTVGNRGANGQGASTSTDKPTLCYFFYTYIFFSNFFALCRIDTSKSRCVAARPINSNRGRFKRQLIGSTEATCEKMSLVRALKREYLNECTLKGSGLHFGRNARNYNGSRFCVDNSQRLISHIAH